MRLLVVFDDRGGELAPLTDLRASFDVRTGALTTLERLERAWKGPIGGLRVPASIAGLVREAHPGLGVNPEPSDALVVAVNGRCVSLPPEMADIEPGRMLIEPGSGEVIGLAGRESDVASWIERGEFEAAPTECDRPRLLHRPWDVRAFRDETIPADLASMAGRDGRTLPEHVVRMGEGSLTIHPSARIAPRVTLDTESGPIVLDAGVRVRPGAVLIGPVYVGPDSVVLDQAIIKPMTAIGPMCKVAGEIGGTIFQGCSNKAHDGHLGDAWVGEWVNLGAGTVNSNLLNTYGEVSARATPGGPMERTGQRYLGCVLGDHVKTAIGTRIMTGAVVHTGAMWASSAPVTGCVEAFAWVTDQRRQRFRVDRFLEAARTMMGRRDVTPSPAYVDRLRTLHRESAG